MNILMIDNHDSFTYNLVHYMETNPYDIGIIVVEPEHLTVDLVTEHDIIGIVVSPGPSRPEDRSEVLGFIEYLWNALPILGVCLGHQMLWHIAGGEVSSGTRPVHGHVSDITHDGKGIFEHIASPLPVTRYHSLECHGEAEGFNVTAKTHDGVNMSIRHKILPIYGLQYHPEAILSHSGKEQLHNFIRIAVEER